MTEHLGELRALVTITLQDLRQRLRDRSVLIFGLAVPLAIIVLFTVLFEGIDDGGISIDPITVAVAAPDGDEVADAVVDVLRSVDAVDVTVEPVPADAVRDAVANGDASAGLVVPEGFGEALTSGQGASVRIMRGGSDGLATRVVETVVDATMRQISAGTVAAAAAAGAGVPVEQLGEIAEAVAGASGGLTVVEGTAADEQLSLQASLVAGQAGLFLLFTVGFGVLSLVEEREQGTLARLQSFPLRHGTIVAAKALGAFLLGVLTTTTLLVTGALLFDTTFGGIGPVAVLVAATVAAATSLVFVVARIARTSEQASVVQSVLAMALGLAGGAFFSIDVDGAIGTVLELNPVAALSRGLGITSGGGGIADLASPLAVLAAFAAVTAVAARLLPDRTAA